MDVIFASLINGQAGEEIDNNPSDVVSMTSATADVRALAWLSPRTIATILLLLPIIHVSFLASFLTQSNDALLVDSLAAISILGSSPLGTPLLLCIMKNITIYVYT